MMKSILAYLISMSLLFSPISVALSANSAQDNLQERTAKRAFLNDLRERVIMFMDQNVAYLSGLKLCLEGQPALIDCDESLRIVRNNIEIQYPKMRRQLLLISLLSFHTHKELMQKFQAHVYNIENNLPTPFLPIDPRIKPNPIEGIWDIEYVPRTPFSDKEIESVLNAGSESVTIDGTNYKENLQNYERFYCESIFEKDHPACKSIQIQYSPKKRVLYFARRPLHEAWQGRDKRLNFEKLSLKTRRLQEAAQDNAKRKFFEIIQENPYVALMSTARPGDSEILKVVSLMLDKAQETRLEYEERMVKLSDPNVSESELLRLMEYGPVAISVLQEPGENMSLVNFDYDSLFEEVSEQHSYDEMMRTGGHVALLIGANILVCWSGGRLIKYLGTARKIIKFRRWHELFNPLCFSLTTIPVNGWFIYDSMNMYHQAYKEVFSSADSLHFIREVNALETAQRSVFWSIILAPVGVGYAAKYATLETLGLSKAFLAHLSRIERLKLSVR